MQVVPLPVLSLYLRHYGAFPGDPVVKHLPCSAGVVGSIPGWGTEIPHATRQLSLCAAAGVHVL